jgi:hypothetical protein
MLFIFFSFSPICVTKSNPALGGDGGAEEDGGLKRTGEGEEVSPYLPYLLSFYTSHPLIIKNLLLD